MDTLCNHFSDLTIWEQRNYSFMGHAFHSLSN